MRQLSRSLFYSFTLFFISFPVKTSELLDSQDLDSLCFKLILLSHAESTKLNINSHCKIYSRFCSDHGLKPFPVSRTAIFRYITYLVHLGRAYGTIVNHLSSIKHMHKFLGFKLDWDQDYHYKLLLRGCQRFIGLSSNRKLPITPDILNNIRSSLDLSTPLHSALWALSLVAFFTFLRKSNLVVDNVKLPSKKVVLLGDLSLSSSGASLYIRATKTIQFNQRSLQIPLPFIVGSPLCPVSALFHHIRINRLCASVHSSLPLFSVLSRDTGAHVPLSYSNFSAFIKRAIGLQGLDSRLFSPHSFRRGGASFAFSCSIPSELIQRLGDWRSDAYLVYLEMTSDQKVKASNIMAQRVRDLFVHI